MTSESVARDTATVLDLRHAEPSFAEQIGAEPGCDTLVNCFQCGLCTGTCPVSELDERFSPAWIIQWVRLGLRQTVLASPLIWYCLQCHRCSFHCPQGVRFADIDAALRARAIEEGFISRDRVRQLAVLEEEWKRARLRQLDRFFQGEPKQPSAVQAEAGSAGGEPKEVLVVEAPATAETGPPPSVASADAVEHTEETSVPDEGSPSPAALVEADGGDDGTAEKTAIDGEELDWGADWGTDSDSRLTTHDSDSGPDTDPDNDSDTDTDNDSDPDTDSDSDTDKNS